MSKRYNELRDQGYVRTGISLPCYKDRAIIEAKAKELKVMGNKVAIVTLSEKTYFRDRTETYRYWLVMVLYSEAYKKAQEEKRAELALNRRQAELRKMADELSLEEIAWMLKDKVDRMPVQELISKEN